MSILQKFGRYEFHQLVLPARTFLPGASPVLLRHEKMCVSTAMVDSPKAVFITRWRLPRRRQFLERSRLRGTSPPCRDMSASQLR